MHIVYKVVNNINGKYYIGVQNTNKQNYLGSGKAITNAIHKYGKENFTKQVLTTCNTKEETYLIESLIITQKLIEDPKCYNMKLGGQGGSLKGSTRPKRSKEYINKQREAKIGTKNPRNYCTWVTPWGKFSSLDNASEKCPSFMSSTAISTACRKNNSKVINNLSVARSKGFLNKEHVGKTYREVGFRHILKK